MSRLRLLLLDAPSERPASYHQGWQRAFLTHPWLQSEIYDLRQPDGGGKLQTALRDADVTILLPAVSESHLTEIAAFAPLLQARRGGLLAFSGHDSNRPGFGMAAKKDLFRKIGVNWLASQLPPETAHWLYGDCAGRTLSAPYGVDEQAFTTGAAWHDRPIELGGAFSTDREWIGDNLAAELSTHAKAVELDPPIQLDLRLDRFLPAEEWASYLRSCRAVLGFEGGSWYLDMDDAALKAIEIMRNPVPSGLSILLGKVGLGEWLRRRHDKKHLDPNAPKDETYEAAATIFNRRAGCPFYSKHVAGRHFEAMATRTLQLLVPGRYNDLLLPGQHYIPIRPDGRDLAEAMERARDPALCGAILDQAQALALDHHTYAKRVTALIQLIAASDQTAA